MTALRQPTSRWLVAVCLSLALFPRYSSSLPATNGLDQLLQNNNVGFFSSSSHGANIAHMAEAAFDRATDALGVFGQPMTTPERFGLGFLNNTQGLLNPLDTFIALLVNATGGDILAPLLSKVLVMTGNFTGNSTKTEEGLWETVEPLADAVSLFNLFGEQGIAHEVDRRSLKMLRDLLIEDSEKTSLGSTWVVRKNMEDTGLVSTRGVVEFSKQLASLLTASSLGDVVPQLREQSFSTDQLLRMLERIDALNVETRDGVGRLVGSLISDVNINATDVVKFAISSFEKVTNSSFSEMGMALQEIGNTLSSNSLPTLTVKVSGDTTLAEAGAFLSKVGEGMMNSNLNISDGLLLLVEGHNVLLEVGKAIVSSLRVRGLEAIRRQIRYHLEVFDLQSITQLHRLIMTWQVLLGEASSTTPPPQSSSTSTTTLSTDSSIAATSTTSTTSTEDPTASTSTSTASTTEDPTASTSTSTASTTEDPTASTSTSTASTTEDPTASTSTSTASTTEDPTASTSTTSTPNTTDVQRRRSLDVPAG